MKVFVSVCSLLMLLSVFRLSVANESGQDQLKGFASDGCSLFPDGWLNQRGLWCACCLAHDIAYWRGGTQDERFQADKALAACVLEKTGNGALADLMYNGVRFGGHPIFPNWYRWGYGWPYGRGYRRLSELEVGLVTQHLDAYEKSPQPYICQAQDVAK